MIMVIEKCNLAHFMMVVMMVNAMLLVLWRDAIHFHGMISFNRLFKMHKMVRRFRGRPLQVLTESLKENMEGRTLLKQKKDGKEDCIS